MELGNLKKWAKEGIGKYKYAILILILGLGLLLLPGRKTAAKNVSQTQAQPSQQLLAQSLSEILQQIRGAGKVEVLLTQSAGEEILYQQDLDITSGESGTQRQDTVIITDAERAQNGLVRQVIPPKYQGAIVVCQGADDPTVKLSIVEAVSRVTGLGADKISVLKMK